MAMNMTNQVRSMTEVAKAVTSGDLTKAIQVDVRGELLNLNKTVNGMTKNLNDFTTQVTRVVREVGTEGLLDRRENLTNVSGSWKVRLCTFQKTSFDRTNDILF
jgi:osomolarity two-component system sensor histidine kinase NIK1